MDQRIDGGHFLAIGLGLGKFVSERTKHGHGVRAVELLVLIGRTELLPACLKAAGTPKAPLRQLECFTAQRTGEPFPLKAQGDRHDAVASGDQRPTDPIRQLLVGQICGRILRYGGAASHQAEMLGQGRADLLPRVGTGILSHQGEKAAACVLVVVLLAIDEGQALTVILHDGGGVVAAVDDVQQKLLIGVVTVKEPLHAHGLWGEHHRYVAVVGDLLENIQGDIGVHDDLPIPGDGNEVGHLEFRRFPAHGVDPPLVLLGSTGDEVPPVGEGAVIAEVGVGVGGGHHLGDVHVVVLPAEEQVEFLGQHTDGGGFPRVGRARDEVDVFEVVLQNIILDLHGVPCPPSIGLG